ncbi:MAG: hypothetical protein J6R96_01545 [Spirochaetaceae bacterium]|nr:hypothetical protein [Spirochaetaceae bacterium]
MATIVRSVYNSLTREAAIEQIQEVLKAYENRIREIRHDTDRLVPEGKDIVDSYCCNEEDEQVLVQKAYSDKAFFEQMPDEQVMQYYQVCLELNKILELGVEGLVPEEQNLLTLYRYDSNKPARHVDLNGGLSWFSSIQDFIDFLGLFGDPTVELYNEMKRADSGDQHAQARLKYVFHEVGRDLLGEISEKSNQASLVCLAIGLPEGSTVFGGISLLSDILLVIDDIISGNIQEGWNDFILIVAGFAVGKGVEKLTSRVATIQITVGSTGRYYEVGRRGAIKTEEALRKILAKDIASGYFGEYIIPEIASQIVNIAVEAFEVLVNEEQ